MPRGRHRINYEELLWGSITEQQLKYVPGKERQINYNSLSNCMYIYVNNRRKEFEIRDIVRSDSTVVFVYCYLNLTYFTNYAQNICHLFFILNQFTFQLMAYQVKHNFKSCVAAQEERRHSVHALHISVYYMFICYSNFLKVCAQSNELHVQSDLLSPHKKFWSELNYEKINQLIRPAKNVSWWIPAKKICHHKSKSHGQISETTSLESVVAPVDEAEASDLR